MSGHNSEEAEIISGLLRNCNELWVGLLVKFDRKAKKGTDLRGQERGEARQSAQRPRERPLQSSVDVLLVPQLLRQLVHLQLEIENAGCPQQKCNGLTVKTPDRTREICTSCCSAIFLSLRDWFLFFMPCGVAFAEDAFMATGAVFELGGLLCSFSIALNRENNRKGKMSRRAGRIKKTSAAIGGRSTKFELLSTATDPTEPISNDC